MDLTIEEYAPGHPDWLQLVQVIAEEQQTQWAFSTHFESFPRYFLAAKHDGQIVGFLMFVVWEIGPHDRGHPPVQIAGETLTEAKIIAFGVREAQRRQGIGRSLQEWVLKRARELGCYQVRSVSNPAYRENHQLKLSMGFGVEPLEHGKQSLVFVMPLR